MANTNNNPLLQGLRGKVGSLVIKQYGNKTVVCKKADMRHVKKTPQQIANNALFAEAAAYAKAICENAAQKKLYSLKTKPGQSVYHYAIQEFYRMRKGENL